MDLLKVVRGRKSAVELSTLPIGFDDLPLLHLAACQTRLPECSVGGVFCVYGGMSLGALRWLGDPF